MKFLKAWLSGPEVEEKQSIAVLEKISEHLKDSDNPEHLAAMAFIMGRVSYADQDFSEQEASVIERVLHDQSQLSSAESKTVVEIIRHLNFTHGATENYRVTRHFADIASREQKERLLDCLFLVSAADDSISSAEEKEIKLIASEIGLSDHNFVETRSKYREYREVLKGLKGN